MTKLDDLLIDYKYAQTGSVGADNSPVNGETRDTLLAAARSELAALRAENEAMRKALEKIAALDCFECSAQGRARTALGGSHG